MEPVHGTAVPLLSRWFYRAMQVYKYVFHPLPVLLGSVLLVAYCEWRSSGADRRSLARRFGVVLGTAAVSVSPPFLFALLTGRSLQRLLRGNSPLVDLVSASSLLVAAGVLWYVWSSRDWGEAVPAAAESISIVAVPYLLVSLVWNVSGHVTFTALAALYLVSVNRRFLPALLVPAVMVVNRPVVGAHTWEQSLAGLALGGAGALVGYVLQRR